MSARRAPSTADISLAAKARESIDLLLSTMRGMRGRGDFSWVFEDIAAYDRLLQQHAHLALSDAQVLEIGYGPRPYRLIALVSAGIDAEGVDAEAPVLHGKAREFITAYRTNGIERVLKSFVRRALFDRPDRRRFSATLRDRGLVQRIEQARFHIGDAVDFQPAHRYDLIVSEDVFEHIPRASLTRLIPSMADWLRPGGLALIRPNIYTGITGGHALNWSRASFTRAAHRTVEPWDHLRRRQHQPNTYLNELTRQDYRELLSTAFEILDEQEALPELGREFFRGAVAHELREWSEEELFSNQVRMVLRRRP